MSVRRSSGVPAGPADRTRFAGALTISLVATGFVLAVNACTGLILARTFSPADRGALAAIMIGPLLIVGVGQLGITDAVTVYAASGGDLGLAEGTIGPIAMVHGLILTAIVAAVGFGLDLGHGNPQALLLSLLYVGPSLWTMWLAHYANGRGQILHLNLVWIGVVACTLVGFLGLIVFHALTVLTAVAVYVVAVAIVTAWATAYFIAHRQAARRFSSAVARSWLRFGLRSNVSGAADVINQYVDQFVIAVALPSKQLGLYAVAVSLTSLSNVVGTGMTYAVLPAIAHATTTAQQRRRSNRAVLIAVALAAIANGALFPAAPFLVRVLFGNAYRGAGRIAQILLVGTGLLSVNSVLVATLKGMGRPQDAGLAQLIGCIVTVALLVVLVPSRGIEGAAITSVLAYGTVTMLLVVLWQRALTRYERAEGRLIGVTQCGS